MRKRLQRQWRLFLTGYWSGQGYDELMVWPLTWWQRAVTDVLFPAHWHEPDPRLIAYCVERRGVTEADIRDCRWLWDRDVVVVRLWNWRRFEVSGMDAVTYRR